MASLGPQSRKASPRRRTLSACNLDTSLALTCGFAGEEAFNIRGALSETLR